MIFGVKRLERASDWEAIVSTKNWVRGHSAFELAHKWHLNSAFPPAVSMLFHSSEVQVLMGMQPEFLMVEMPTFLDTAKAPSWTDIMVHARNKNRERVVIGVEGKAKETFAEPVHKWVRDNRGLEHPPKTTRLRRLEYLSNVLGRHVSEGSTLRYQLLHRTAATVLEGEKADSVANVILIHSFDESKQDNWNDFSAFVNLLGVGAQKNVILGPIVLGSAMRTPSFFAWVSDEKVANNASQGMPRSARQP